MAEKDLGDTYKSLIREALKELRKDLRELGFLNASTPGSFRILPPLDTGGKVEVLFMAGKEEPECWTAYFEDVEDPAVPLLASGW